MVQIFVTPVGPLGIRSWLLVLVRAVENGWGTFTTHWRLVGLISSRVAFFQQRCGMSLIGIEKKRSSNHEAPVVNSGCVWDND